MKTITILGILLTIVGGYLGVAAARDLPPFSPAAAPGESTVLPTLPPTPSLEPEQPTNVTLTLYVHENSSSGPVIVGAQVTGSDGAGNSFDQTTNSSGYVTITRAPGTWSFTASKTGYESNSWSQSITATDTKHAFLAKQATKEPPVQIPETPYAFQPYKWSDDPIQFAWTDEEGAEVYQWRILDANDLHTVLEGTTYAPMSWVDIPARNLLSDEYYMFEVRACADASLANCSSWSARLIFRSTKYE